MRGTRPNDQTAGYLGEIAADADIDRCDWLMDALARDTDELPVPERRTPCASF